MASSVLPVETTRIHWTPAARRKLHPTRPAPPVPYDGPPPWARIGAAWRPLADAIAAGVTQAETACQPAMRKVVESATRGQPPSALEVDVEVARMTLLGVGTFGWIRDSGPKKPFYAIYDNPDYSTESLDQDGLEEALMAYWLDVANAAFTMEVLVRADDYEPCKNEHARWFAPQRNKVFLGSRLSPRWRLLRQHLCSADDASYTAALTRAVQLWPACTLSTRCALAFAFPSHSVLANETALDLFGEPDAARGRQHWLMASITDPDAARALVGRVSGYEACGLILDLIDRVGVHAVPVLEGILRGRSHKDACAIFEALAMIEADSAFRALARHLEKAAARAPAAKAFARAPERAIKALETVERTPRVAALLTQLEAQRSAYAAGLPRPQTIAGLPDVLVNPPWLQKRRRPAPRVVLGLTPPDIPDRIVWAPGQRARWRSDGIDIYKPSVGPERDAELMAELEDPAKEPHLSWVDGLTDEAAIALLNRMPPERWFAARFHWRMEETVQQLLARLDRPAVPALIAIAQIDLPRLLPCLFPICSLRAAPLMAEGFARLKSVRQIAQRWLERFPREATLALVPQAVGQPGDARTYAETALRYLASRDDGAVREIARDYGADALAAVEAVLADDPLLRFPSRLPKAPAFWNPHALPLVRLRDREDVLPTEALDTVRVMVAISPPPHDPYPGLAIVRDACDRRSLAECAWAIYTQWDTAGRPGKESWALDALGLLGDDDTANQLTPLVRAWPSTGQLGQATRGLDALVRIGSDTALMQLYRISQKVKSRPLKLAAADRIQDVAAARHLTSEELADRLVPDLGLDRTGSRELDFGARVFRVGFDEQLRPFVTDAEGGRLKELPKPGRNDDAEKGATATALWKDLKAEVRKTAKDQLDRLERAMCHRRRWSDADFRRWLVEHPLLTHLVKRLVWGVYDASDTLVAAFRVAEDGTFATVDDDAFTLPAAARIGIVHRLDLPADEVTRWASLLTEYKILQPFPQIARPVYLRTDEDRRATTIDLVKGLQVPATRWLTLRRKGWRLGPTIDGGNVATIIKTLAGDAEAILDLDPGLHLGDIAGEPQTLGTITVQRTTSWGDEAEMTAADLDDISYSEIITDLKALAKGA